MSSVATFCSLPFQKIKVSPQGDVSMCCYQRGSLGNLFRKDFEEIWHGYLANEIRAVTLDGALHPVCEGWGGCPFLVKPRTAKTALLPHSYPTALEFDLPNTHCNIGGTSPTPDSACFMCPRAARDFSPEPDLSHELAERLAFLMPYLREVRVQGTAEPFWKDRAFHVLEKLGFGGYKDACVFSTYTNGVLLNKDARNKLLHMCPNASLFFSVDAATPETYRTIRRLNAFEQVVGNIRDLVREKGGRRVDIANNLNMLNLHEAIQMIELARDLNVDYVQFNPTHEGGSVREDLRHILVNRQNYRLFAEAQIAITERAKQLGVNIYFVRPLDLGLSVRPMRQAAEQFAPVLS